MKLSEAVLRTIDTEIKPLIIQINELSCVRKTVYSCAGYGESGLGKRPPYAVSRDDPRGHRPQEDGLYHGYLMLAYKEDENWRPYHQALTETVNDFKRSRQPKYTLAYAYYLMGTPEFLAQKWAEVADITRYMTNISCFKV